MAELGGGNGALRSHPSIVKKSWSRNMGVRVHRSANASSPRVRRLAQHTRRRDGIAPGSATDLADAEDVPIATHE